MQTYENKIKENLEQEIEKLSRENELLRRNLDESVKNYNNLLNFVQQANYTLQTNKDKANNAAQNVFDTAANNNYKAVKKTNSFGVYKKYTPIIQNLINYAKTHTIPVKTGPELQELKALVGNEFTAMQMQPNMNILFLKDGYYIKLLQNLVAIYGPNTYYHLDFTLDGQATCVGKNHIGYESCKRIGGTDSKPNKRIPSWKIYKLPSKIS